MKADWQLIETCPEGIVELKLTEGDTLVGVKLGRQFFVRIYQPYAFNYKMEELRVEFSVTHWRARVQQANRAAGIVQIIERSPELKKLIVEWIKANEKEKL